MTYEQRKAKAFESRQGKPVLTSESLSSKAAQYFVFKNLHKIGSLQSIEHTVYPEYADYFTRFIGTHADLVINSGLGSGYSGEGPRTFKDVLITLGLHPERVHDFIFTGYPSNSKGEGCYTRTLTHTMSAALLLLLHKSTRLSRPVDTTEKQFRIHLKGNRYTLSISPHLQNAYTYKITDKETGGFIIIQYEKGVYFQSPQVVSQHGFIFDVNHLPKTVYEDALSAISSGVFFHVLGEIAAVEASYKNAQSQ